MIESELLVPDRFDALHRCAPDRLSSIIVPVEEALEHLGHLSADIRSARRGSFVVLRGQSGSGKSTFLHTLDLFWENTETFSLPSTDSIPQTLADLAPTESDLRVLVLEGREAAGRLRGSELEAIIQHINTFLRSPAGERTLVVWPCNTEDLEERLVSTARVVGGDALLGIGAPVFRFRGPRPRQYIGIAQRTVATLNEGASLLDLGVSDRKLQRLARDAETIGAFLGSLRKELLNNTERVRALLAKETCRLWILVVAGNGAEGDVAALTRGSLRAADTERLLAETEANIANLLRDHPEKLGILSAVLDVKILHLPVLAALDAVRAYPGDVLRRLLSENGVSQSTSTIDRQGISKTDLGCALRSEQIKPSRVTRTPGASSAADFKKIVKIARRADSRLNRAIGRALQAAGLVAGYQTEQAFGRVLALRTDISCESMYGTIRLEVMWRSKTSRSEIAVYVLQKVFNYGRAIGLVPVPYDGPPKGGPDSGWRRTQEARTVASEWARYTTGEEDDFEVWIRQQVKLFRAGTSPRVKLGQLRSRLERLRQEPTVSDNQEWQGLLRVVGRALETARLQASYGERQAAEEAMDHCARIMADIEHQVEAAQKKRP